MGNDWSTLQWVCIFIIILLPNYSTQAIQLGLLSLHFCTFYGVQSTFALHVPHVASQRLAAWKLSPPVSSQLPDSSLKLRSSTELEGCRCFSGSSSPSSSAAVLPSTVVPLCHSSSLTFLTSVYSVQFSIPIIIINLTGRVELGNPPSLVSCESLLRT
ncbi:hypothetical protein VTN77DRAFT_9078 [Rasamsonia byssochlamydoides]|uniref:uncharacterized protein n=1 Tax=Rasamsonia byssochlamydoides TaxID=89139 RepID=UPI00374432A6